MLSKVYRVRDILSWSTLDEEQSARLQAMIDRQKKELAKQRQKLAAYEDRKIHLKLLDDMC